MPYPLAGVAIAVGQGIVEEYVPQFCRARALVDQLQEPVEPRGDRHHFGQRHCRIDAVEQGERELGVLAGIGRYAVFTYPARFLAPDGSGHQIVRHNPPCDQQRGFPAQTERIAPRRPPERIAATQRHTDRARGIRHHAMIGQMRQKRRLPPRRPAIGAGIIAQIGRRRQPHALIMAEGGLDWVWCVHHAILSKGGPYNPYGYV